MTKVEKGQNVSKRQFSVTNGQNAAKGLQQKYQIATIGREMSESCNCLPQKDRKNATIGQIHLPAYLSISPSIYLSIYLSIYKKKSTGYGVDLCT